jgi:hypothetical protein
VSQFTGYALRRANWVARGLGRTSNERDTTEWIAIVSSPECFNVSFGSSSSPQLTGKYETVATWLRSDGRREKLAGRERIWKSLDVSTSSEQRFSSEVTKLIFLNYL